MFFSQLCCNFYRLRAFIPVHTKAAQIAQTSQLIKGIAADIERGNHMRFPICYGWLDD